MKKAFQKKTANCPLGNLPKLAVPFAQAVDTPPLSHEIDLMHELFGFQDLSQPCFHGGTKGLSVGDTLLPSAVTGLDPQNFCDPSWKKRRVYVTQLESKARLYAANIDGDTYQVKMRGLIGIDIQDVRIMALILDSPQMKKLVGEHGPFARQTCMKEMSFSLTCESAEIVAVLT